MELILNTEEQELLLRILEQRHRELLKGDRAHGPPRIQARTAQE